MTAMDCSRKAIRMLVCAIRKRLGLDDPGVSTAARTAREWLIHEARAEHIARLTPAQHRVVALLREGHSDKRIAAELRLSECSVANHLVNARRRAEGPLPEARERRAQRLRERRVAMLCAMAQGMPDKLAAVAAGLSAMSSDHHLTAMRAEAGVHTTMDLIKRALDLRLIPDPGPLPTNSLTPEQRALLPLLERGLSSAAIQSQQGISQYTLRRRLTGMLKSLREVIGLPAEASTVELRHRLMRRSEKVVVRVAAATDARRDAELSVTDLEIARLVRERVSNPAIRERLGISSRALKMAIRRLRLILGADTLGPRRTRRRKGEGGVLDSHKVRARLFALDRATIAAAKLTPRQGEIIRLTMFGLSTEEICQQTGLATPTVTGHRCAAYRRLGITG